MTLPPKRNRAPSKVHSKRKAYRAALKQATKDGKMNNSEGMMVNRATLTDNSMRRDYHPQ